MKTLFFATSILSICLCPAASAQELVTRQYEKGYMQMRQKVSVWEYYDYEKQLEIKVNHTTGKVYYLKPDTTDYVIFDEGQWTTTKLRFYPTPMTGYWNFNEWLARKLNYSVQARRDGVEGEVIVMFEVDTVGVVENFQIVKEASAGLGQDVIETIQAFEMPWLPARLNERLYRSRFLISIYYSLGSKPSRSEIASLPMARRLVFNLNYQPGPPGVPSYTDPGPFYSLPKALASKQNVGRLNLINQELTSFPIDIFKLEHLKVLDLERNSISKVPREIATLRKLKELYLPINHLEDLPAEIGNLKNLSYLGLASNQFAKFPQAVFNITNLEGLDLGNNKLAEIPPGIANLRNLKLISLANNSLRTLPEEFFQLKKLEMIYLNDNHFDQTTIDRVNATFRKATIVWTTKAMINE